MRDFRLATGVLIAIGLSGALHASEPMPIELQGVWAREAPGACQMPALDAVAEFPVLIVTPAGYAAHEAACTLTQARRASSSDAGSWLLTFSCRGEGETWPTSEHWSLQRRVTPLSGWRISVARLIRDGEAFTPCPLHAAPVP
ncbi:hypothetical protein V5F44_18560 [Xanthobacter sp. V2C-8]|uniref:hypothetical protein n=1 Tax=Xanthobacter albus TaxID=3119929 RepID=UPI0037274470